MLKVNVWFMTTDALPVTVEIDDGGSSFSDEIEKQDYVLDYLMNNGFSDKEELTFKIV
ncbi:hypothetical protein PQZ66_gp07 [Klebsiella phage vB_KleM_KB2]|jgi:hypothetical protein|uniref:hypothetical protein n=1 Tax=Klebsiella phage vB_KleM_KB2 TaxID=2759197 RepID=UPI0020605CE8|nr:hypothetical protein PQZ66_gp07 [Klebsiella phage vB_KleM_KB2]UVM95908.1 MAG: hypothetical protein [Bacteriophage sp.]DAR02977.1 MAG TPA: hypothetical protein [Caudoviricetes sp.]DAV69912.1 MAG TPA: hypothetical protein [Caudoviricetes sp.]